jgi:hypothetical protein
VAAGRPSLRANAKMQRRIAALAAASLPPLSGRILRILDDGLVESHGSVLLKALSLRADRFDARRHGDLTVYECQVNHLRFDAAPAGADRALATALTYAGQLVEMLDRSGSAGPFRVIVAQETPDGACGVRFHRLRAEESWPAADGDGDAAMLVLECGAPEAS